MPLAMKWTCSSERKVAREKGVFFKVWGTASTVCWVDVVAVAVDTVWSVDGLVGRGRVVCCRRGLLS